MPTRSSLDAAILAHVLLRTAVGGTMIAHGVNHGRDLEGTARWFDSIGFKEPQLQARLSCAVEVGSGLFLIAGAATPVAASAVIGTMTVAICAVHWPNGYFIVQEGWEYAGLLAVASVAVAALESGLPSIDHRLGQAFAGTPLKRALFATVVGVSSAAVQLSTTWRGRSARK